MSKPIIPRDQIWSGTKERLEKLIPEITEVLLDRGHRIDLSLVKDICEIVYVHENKASEIAG